MAEAPRVSTLRNCALRQDRVRASSASLGRWRRTGGVRPGCPGRARWLYCSDWLGRRILPGCCLLRNSTCYPNCLRPCCDAAHLRCLRRRGNCCCDGDAGDRANCFRSSSRPCRTSWTCRWGGRRRRLLLRLRRNPTRGSSRPEQVRGVPASLWCNCCHYWPMTNKRMDQEVVVVVVMLLMNSPSFMVWNLWKCFEELFCSNFFISVFFRPGQHKHWKVTFRPRISFVLFIFGWEEF